MWEEERERHGERAKEGKTDGEGGEGRGKLPEGKRGEQGNGEAGY